jgi:hypothetical protein
MNRYIRFALGAAIGATLGIGVATYAKAGTFEDHACKEGALTSAELEASFIKYGAVAAQYGISLRKFEGEDAAKFINLADELDHNQKFPGDAKNVATVMVFKVSNAEVLPKARVFVYRSADCLVFQMDWPTAFVNTIVNEYDKRNV